MDRVLDTPAQLEFERAFYVGSYITGILYGVQLFMFFLSNYYLLSLSSESRRESLFYIVYGSVMLFLWTIASAANAEFGLLAWVDHRDVEGGPAQYIHDNLAAWYNTLGTVAGICMNFLADGLLLYRCYIIWGSTKKIIAFPVLIYFGAMAMSIILIYESALPGASFFKGTPLDFGVPYFWMTISLNIITTSLICGRLLAVRNRVRAILGEQHCTTYTGVVAVLLESALPSTVISYARNSPYSFAFLQIWADFYALMPQIIILRVAMGKAWSKATVASVSVLVFDHRTEKGKLNGSGDLELDLTAMQGTSLATDTTTVDSRPRSDKILAIAV
ncbi:hypothetical protein FB45DRAFT_1027761 [Roridomyces roridus]|uniref:Uncharacterized protein n=1 Tax=Roridomyces roridus TaxID=1738132 RepID=A0AAD7FKZ5_9AGAR|nr:hypothetical protein FB45DRAFT_1027761 [Roridomyces roridus]